MVQNGSQPLPGPQRMFFDTPTCPEQIPRNFWKVELSTSKSIFSCCIALQAKKRVFSIIPGPNLSLSSQVFTKRFQGSEVYDQIKFFVDWIFHTSVIFEKNRFFASLIAKILQKHAKILWKMLEKSSKNVENFFFEITSNVF